MMKKTKVLTTKQAILLGIGIGYVSLVTIFAAWGAHADTIWIIASLFALSYIAFLPLFLEKDHNRD